MKRLAAMIFVLGAAAIVTVARGGHELPIYPSFYPHEIEIKSVAPEQAAQPLHDGKIQAYVGQGLSFSGALPAEIWNSFMRVAHKGVPPAPLPGKPWVHQEPQEDQVIAAQPQVDGAPDDQPVAMEPVTTAEAPRSTGRPIADWLSRVLSR